MDQEVPEIDCLMNIDDCTVIFGPRSTRDWPLDWILCDWVTSFCLTARRYTVAVSDQQDHMTNITICEWGLSEYSNHLMESVYSTFLDKICDLPSIIIYFSLRFPSGMVKLIHKRKLTKIDFVYSSHHPKMSYTYLCSYFRFQDEECCWVIDQTRWLPRDFRCPMHEKGISNAVWSATNGEHDSSWNDWSSDVNFKDTQKYELQQKVKHSLQPAKQSW